MSEHLTCSEDGAETVAGSPPRAVAEIMLGGEGGKAADFANYFSSYAFLYHQKQMLTDASRMAAYRDAILENGACFKDKVVLDVGAGSGILSIWAARAGAKKVIACEFTTMAVHARALVAANGLADVVEVRQSAVEALDLGAESVDVIISEWMGYFLLRESMLDSVLYARDHYMKKGGSLWPSRATMYWAPAAMDAERGQKLSERTEAMADWDAFCGEMTREHGVDVACLRAAYEKEQTSFYLRQSQWTEMRPEAILAEPVCVKDIDLYTATVEDTSGIDAPFDFRDLNMDTVSAFAGWFSVDFEGSKSDPAPTPITLSTAPEDGYTHWGQQVFFIPPRDLEMTMPLCKGRVTMRRQREMCRLYLVGAELETLKHHGSKDDSKKPLALEWELS